MSEPFIGAFNIGVYSRELPKGVEINEGEYAFNISYKPNKCDIEVWSVIISASNFEAARADTRRRYPRQKGYSVSFVQHNDFMEANPIRLIAQEAAK